MMTKILWGCCTVLCVAFLFCDDDNPAESNENLIKASEGGTLSTENGISLIIPPDALEKDTEITLTPLDGSAFDASAVIGVKLGPDGLVFKLPVLLRFPLPADWPENELPAIYEAPGTNPQDFMLTGLAAGLTGSVGKYKAELELEHFTSIAMARNCHMGAMTYLMRQFEQYGCDIDIMTNQVRLKHGNKFSVDPFGNQPGEYTTGNVSMQCFLDYYFDNARGFEEWEEVSQSFLDRLEGYMKWDEKEIVVAFNTKWEDNNSDGFYDGFAHSAVLEIVNGELKLRQSVSAKDSVIDKLVAKNGDNVFYYPQSGSLTAEQLNSFRQLKSGVGVEMELCGAPGCLFKHKLENRATPYKAIRFYVSKYTHDDNPCNPGQTCIQIAYPLSPEESVFDESFQP